jgi:small subunit ribosomal protein S17
MARKVVGIVSSNVQDKTIVVTSTTRETHPLYGKKFTISRKYTAHDETNQAHKGDRVEISETRPVSKRKTWKLDRIIETGHAEVSLRDETVETESK